MKRLGACALWCLGTLGAAPTSAPDDWPQFMRDSAHTGDAPGETLRLPLGLATRVQLDDAILSSPAVVRGRIFVVDQMGTAYAVDPKANKVIWKVSPDGETALGGNTGSPCVVDDKVYFGTTAGRVHVLDARDGRTLAGVDVGSPVPDSLTYANDSLYFQTLDARVIRMDLAGKTLWTHDHYRDYKWPGSKKDDYPKGHRKPQFAGGKVAVSGKQVVATLGCDLLRIDDLGDQAKVVWCNRESALAAGAAIVGEWVYVAEPYSDGDGGYYRVRLADGAGQEKRMGHWNPMHSPAVRGETLFVQSHTLGMLAYEFPAVKDKAPRWTAFDASKWKGGLNPGVASPALAGEHCVFATVSGEIWVVAINGQSDWKRGGFTPAPFRFKIPSGKFIGSSPVVSGGAIYFGSDDGCLYGLAADGKLDPASPPIADLSRPRSRTVSATGKPYSWPGPYGQQSNDMVVDDPAMKPPFRVRWIAPSQATFKQPLIASETDVFFASLEGTVAAYEQATGRLRWRRRVDGPMWCRHTPTYVEDCLLVPRPAGVVRSYATLPPGTRTLDGSQNSSVLHCLNAADGSTKWTAPLGGNFHLYQQSAATVTGGVVAYPMKRGESLVIQAWDLKTGAEKWNVEMIQSKGEVGVSGCVLDGTMYFSGVIVGAGRTSGSGVTLALEPATGKLLWRNADHAGGSNLAGRDGKLLLISTNNYLACLSAKDGALVWKHDEKLDFWRAVSFGPELVTGRTNDKGVRKNEVFHAVSGKPLREDGKPLIVSSYDHSCGAILQVSSGITLVGVPSGLSVSDFKTGKPLWTSLGFGSMTCTNPIAANGRVFFNPQFSGRIYCFEPIPAKQP